jgi:hypothetical protein
MLTQESNYELLIRKLDEFIRKYYKNAWIRGAIYSAAILLVSFLLISVPEYYFYLGTTARTIIFYLFLLINTASISLLVAVPLLHYYRLGKIIDHETAARIIGEHFSEVSDKLINILQLHELSVKDHKQNILIEASINQKIELLRPVPFTRAIDFSKNRKYAKYAMIPLGIFLVILFSAPSIITESTRRLINHGIYFEKPAPFQYLIQNEKMEAVQGNDYVLSVKMAGTEIPQDIYLITDGQTYKLDKSSVIQFSYTFRNLQKNRRFRFMADGFYSKEYDLSVIAKPMVMRFDIQAEYPAYLGKKAERIENNGDITVPQGTQLRWTFYAENTDEILFDFSGNRESLSASGNQKFSTQRRAMKDAFYSLQAINRNAVNNDSVAYTLHVIPDLFPSISVTQKTDSVRSKLYYFMGSVKDDYGFSRLTFNYRKVTGETQTKLQSTNIPVSTGKNSDAFFYYWDLSSIQIAPGEQLEYYFEIWDNDGVNGSKPMRSETMMFIAPTDAEIRKQTEQNNTSLKDKMSEVVKQSEQLQREARKLNERLLDKKSLSFDEKKQVQQLVEKQKELEQAIQEISKQNQDNNIREQEYKNLDPSILEKKKQLEEMFNNVLDEKTKDLIRQLEKLLEQNNKEKTQDQLQQMQMDNKDLQKEMDRMLELFKQLEFDQKLQESIDKLDDLQKKQEELSKESQEKSADPKEMARKQNELNKELNELKKDMQDLEKKNQEMENPEDFENPDDEMDDIGKDMDKSEEDLNNNKKDKAAQSQKKAADKMKELSVKMRQKAAQGKEQELDLNMKALREILENLIKVSFDQERTMEELKKTMTADPRYLTLTQKQKALKDDLKMIEDSLYALSKKVMQIQTFVNKEIGQINKNMQRSIENLADRRTADATNRQQYVMTSVNNLAVMLSEVLQQMQDEMMQQKKGGKPGSKPGKKPGKNQGSSLSKMQDQLNKQIQQMKDGMQQPGGSGKGSKGQMSEQLAKMAAQQQAIRNALQQMENQMGKDGESGSSQELNKLKKEMEKTETDLYNRNITQETLNRQKEIMSRLLETEKAQREREYDNKREAQSGKDQNINYNIVFEEYKKMKLKELELLKTVPPALNPYYKDKVGQYFEQLNKQP